MIILFAKFSRGLRLFKGVHLFQTLEYVDSQAKIFLILYPPFENFTNHIAIMNNDYLPCLSQVLPVTISIPTLEGLSAFVAGWHSFVGSYKMSHVIFETVKSPSTGHTSQIFRSHIGTIWDTLNFIVSKYFIR